MIKSHTKEMIKDGVGMQEQSSIVKKHLIMSCLTQGIEKLTFLAI
jgi:hypothetical protein